MSFAQAPNDELNTLLMHATFEVYGPAAGQRGMTALGTVFFMGMPIKGDDQHASAVLVTAAHVLDEIGGDAATILLRRKSTDGSYVPFPFPFKIRNNGVPLYVKHDTADVAAMYMTVPKDLPITLLTPDFLADDKRIEELGIHPGDEVFCLGFPFSTGGPGGFPFLRAGRLASYPITPARDVKEWAIDALVQPGNSGGPVYFFYENRKFGDGVRFRFDRGVLGLVIQQINSGIPEFRDKTINYGFIVPAQFIRETLDKLPSESPYK